MTFNIYRIIWMLLHVLYSVTHYLVFLWITVRKKFEELISKSPTDELRFISHHIKLLVKVPSHLVVIIGNEHASFPDLANITVWCLAAGISFVSFYDHYGVLKRKEAELVTAVTKRLGSKDHIMNSIIWGRSTTTNGHVKKNGTNGTNGHSTVKVTVNVFSLHDGKRSVVDVTHELCALALSGDMTASRITVELIDAMLNEKTGVPEPELAFYCGDTCSTYGFLPWHIRVTEFLQLHSHHNIKVTDFMNLLNKFGDCQQRFGK